MLYYLGFFALSVGVLMEVWALVRVHWLGDLLPASDRSWANVPFLFLLGTYVFLVFGFLSRRCERQADLFGCRAVSCGQADCTGDGEIQTAGLGLCGTGIQTFIRALERVAELNGIHRRRPGWLQSWQHSTIARRVAFLEEVLADPMRERRFQRHVLFIKWLILAGLVTVLVGLLTMTDGQIGWW
jgi:STE24 endopeptidase